MDNKYRWRLIKINFESLYYWVRKRQKIYLNKSIILLPNVSKLTRSSNAPLLCTCPKTAMPIIAYINVIRNNRAPMLNNAGKDTIRANNNFLMPLAACNLKKKDSYFLNTHKNYFFCNASNALPNKRRCSLTSQSNSFYSF